MMLDLTTKLKIISELCKHNIKYDGNTINITISDDGLLEYFKKNLTDSSINFIDIGNEINIEIKSCQENLGIKIFYDKEEFLKDFELKDLKSNFSIINYDRTILVYSIETETSFNEKQEAIGDCFIENTTSYIKFLENLKTIADYINETDNELVFYSSSNGIFKLKYPNIKPNFDSSKSIKQDCDNFIEKTNIKDFKAFIINEFFTYVESENTSFELINKLNKIITQATNNYELYIKEFSFDKFKSDLQKEKEKYFSSLREIIGKVLNQTVAIPLSLSTTIFAVYKVENNDFAIIIMLFSFIIYSIFAIFIEFLYLKDLLEIKNDFDYDIENIKEKSGIKNEDVYNESKKIYRRIHELNILIIVLIVVMTILPIIISLYIIPKIHSSIYEIFSLTSIFVLYLSELFILYYKMLK